MIDIKTYKTFIRFLKENDIYEKYIKNVNNSEITFYNFNERRIYEAVGYNEELTDIYDWEDSNEGFEFWSDINDEWKHLLSNTNILSNYKLK